MNDCMPFWEFGIQSEACRWDCVRFRPWWGCHLKSQKALALGRLSDIAWRLGRQGAYRGDQILTALCHSQGCRNIPWFCTHMWLYVTGQWCSCDKHVLVWTDLSALLEPTVRLKPQVPTHDKLLPAFCSDWGSCLCKICSLRAYDHSCNIPFVF